MTTLNSVQGLQLDRVIAITRVNRHCCGTHGLLRRNDGHECSKIKMGRRAEKRRIRQGCGEGEGCGQN
jgi:hypothetical protein